ncbi:MAG TPA: universal stress protein, partial [Thermodesulfobacteriota bacterium]|nr:universal stress protein [Thermodesulfobacteriota bacterium]
MIDKILWASDGSKDSVEALRYAELLATRFKAKIFGLYVIPDYYELAERLPSDKKDRFTEWVEETKSKERESLGQIARHFKEKGTGFDLEITVGIPHKEILRVAERERVDL